MSKFSRNGGIIGNQVDTSAGQSGVWGDYDAFSLKKNSQWGTIAVPPGSATYTTAGTYSWPAPPIVTSVCVVCIGGGGGGHQAPSNSGGGGGGGLAFGNDIPVVGVPVIHCGCWFWWKYPHHHQRRSNATDGGDSYFINSSTLCGKGGHAGKYATSAPPQGQGVTLGNAVTGGGIGGNGSPAAPPVSRSGGGGGAGGYGGSGSGAGSGSDLLPLHLGVEEACSWPLETMLVAAVGLDC